MYRRHNFQTISWFWDLFQRQLLELDPPYQRRSVWNQDFKDYFVDTILLEYPAPAIFLYEEITAAGSSRYNVVDGKQRLTTIFEFVRNQFAVSDKSEMTPARGKYFKDLDDDLKRKVWGYQFLVEYLPSADISIINNIFDRINRNVAKLTPQELRHARFNGAFISTTEQLAEWLAITLPRNVPRFGGQSKMQMKDVEFVAVLLLYLEEGAKGQSQADLDEAFAARDVAWERQAETENLFRQTISILQDLFGTYERPNDLATTRARNQADFYSLFAAVANRLRDNTLPPIEQMIEVVREFVRLVEDDERRITSPEATAYYEAARSASNDKGPRETRIEIMERVLAGELL